ncbi:MAG: hypothetical protein ACRECH_10385, partial [Nitrososphaerales archaeon]
MAERVLVSWSGGKDSALSVLELSRSPKEEFEIAAILTTLTEGYDRVSMHGVRRELLERQSRSLGIPLEEVWIPKNASNNVYESKMGEVIEKYGKRHVSSVAFGDLFLQGIREYREKFIQKFGAKCIFPIWGRNTGDLADFFIDSGFKAIICCVNPKLLGKEYCGREFNKSFLSELPKTVDPCGENGEFHTFVY